MRFLDRGFIIRALLVTMLYSLVLLGEYFLLLYLRDYFETFLIIAAVTSTSLLGLLTSLGPVRRALDAVHESINAGYYPQEPFAMLAGTMFSSLLLVTPGFATDLVGALLLIPVLRRLVGRALTRGLQTRLKELYEYLKLCER